MDLKTVFSDFCGQNLICDLILALVSLWLLLNSFKETSKEKNVRLIFLIILFKDILIILLLFYLFFDFQRGYGTTKRSEFILTEVNG